MTPPRITLLHPAFGHVGGAEVLVLRHAVLLRSLGCDVRVVTRRYDRERWQSWTAPHDVAIDHVPRGWWEKQLNPGPARTLHAAAQRLAPHLAGADCVVAYNAPAPAILGTRLPDRARTAWHCNEPPRELHFPETARTAVAHLPAHALVNAPARATPADADSFLALPDLTWVARKLAWYQRRLTERPRFVVERSLDIQRVRALGHIVALSNYSAETVRMIYGRGVDAVVYPLVPEPPSVPRRAGVDRAGGLHVLLHSRFEPMKNIGGVLRGFARFRARVPGAHTLHVVGTGSLAEPLRTSDDARALGDAVRWHGYLDDGALAAVYARCDVLAALPFDEPFGMVFPEAALRGLLLIGPDHGGPVEILDGGALGWAVDAFDPEPLADALEAVWRLSDGEADRRRTQVAAACRERYGAAAIGPQLREALLD